MIHRTALAPALLLTGIVLAAASPRAGIAAPADAPSGPQADDATRIEVFVSIPPQAAFVERVGGEHVRVGVLVPPGQSPHTFEPTPKQMAQLAGARVFFAIGLPLETRLLEKARAANPGLRVVDTRQGVPLRRMTADEAGPADEHGHDHAAGEPDPHTWLNPRYAKIQAATICRTLQEMDPTRKDEYRKNLEAFQADLDAVDARIAKALAPVKGKELLVFHPAFGYFAEAYGLRQVAVEVEGKEPNARALAALIERAKAGGARVIFVQPQFSPKTAEAVARAIGGVVVPMDALARDYLGNLEEMAAKVLRALRPQ